MKSKCDECVHNVLADETSVGAGFVPICNKYHWTGAGPEDEENGYCDIWDNCKDYKECEKNNE